MKVAVIGGASTCGDQSPLPAAILGGPGMKRYLLGVDVGATKAHALGAGTGCNAWGWDRSRRVGRVTGYGTWLGEGAGASELVGNALRGVTGMVAAWSGHAADGGLCRAVS
jgi:hypothetical protein